MRKRWLALGMVSVAACGAGEYGHARTYSPLDAEAIAAENAEDYDPVMVERQPEAWARKTVSVFGIVEKRTDLPGGKVELTLSVRRLEARNLCETAAEDSCRT